MHAIRLLWFASTRVKLVEIPLNDYQQQRIVFLWTQADNDNDNDMDSKCPGHRGDIHNTPKCQGYYHEMAEN